MTRIPRVQGQRGPGSWVLAHTPVQQWGDRGCEKEAQETKKRER